MIASKQSGAEANLLSGNTGGTHPSPAQQVFDQMGSVLTSASHKYVGKVSQKEFEDFQREYLFHMLRNQTIGQAFCSTFKIRDFMLMGIIVDPEDTYKYINNMGYVSG